MAPACNVSLELLFLIRSGHFANLQRPLQHLEKGKASFSTSKNIRLIRIKKAPKSQQQQQSLQWWQRHYWRRYRGGGGTHPQIIHAPVSLTLHTIFGHDKNFEYFSDKFGYPFDRFPYDLYKRFRAPKLGYLRSAQEKRASSEEMGSNYPYYSSKQGGLYSNYYRIYFNTKCLDSRNEWPRIDTYAPQGVEKMIKVMKIHLNMVASYVYND